MNMKRLSILSLSLLLGSALTGCSSLPEEEEMQPAAAIDASADRDAAPVLDAEVTPMVEPGPVEQVARISPSVKPQADFPDENLSDYVTRLAQKLVASSPQLRTGSRVGVASFVDMDTLSATSALGRQMAAGFMTELQQQGLAVIDFHARDTIKITPEGEFIFSRDVNNLQREHQVNLILSGTLTPQRNGVQVNVRLIDLRSKVLAGSAQGLIPRQITALVLDGKRKDGVLILEQN